MKDRLIRGEMAEYAARADLFGRHLESLDWQKIRRAMLINRNYPWHGMVSVVLGVKPVFVFGEEEAKTIKPLHFVPEQMRNNFIFLEKKGVDEAEWYQGWLIDTKNLLIQYKKHSQYFDNFDWKKAEKPGYLKSYVGGLTTDWNATPIEFIRAGLSVGYPLSSVLNASREHVRTYGFSHKGFEFASAKGDLSTFKMWLDKIYGGSGMDRILKRNTERLEHEFSKQLKSAKESIRAVTLKGEQFLELKYVDLAGNAAGVQLVRVKGGKMSSTEAGAYLNIFAETYNVPELKFTLPEAQKAGEMGVFYEAYHDRLLKSSTSAKTAYLTKKESATIYEPGLEVIDRKAIGEWLNQNGHPKLSQLF